MLTYTRLSYMDPIVESL